MAYQHTRSKFANGGLHAVRQASDSQQQLMLLRLDSARACLVFAKPQKPADLITEFRQRLKLVMCETRGSRPHRYIVSRYVVRHQSTTKSWQAGDRLPLMPL